MHGGETVLTEAARTRVNTGDYKSTYRIGRTLGSGSYAKVKVGEDRATSAKYAIKVIDRSKLTTEDADALGMEVATMMRVHHPNIVALREVYDAPKEFVMVLELCTGGELFDRIATLDHYSEKQAAHAFVQMNEAIGHCHEHGIVHRDLKPENLLYAAPSPDETLKLADFGFAAILNNEASLLRTCCGTPAYVAPEILKGKGYTAAVDMWSLGVILYVLLCGFPPFQHENTTKLFKLIQRAEYEFPSPFWDAISSPAKDLICRLLVTKGEKRLTADQVVEHAWMSDEAHGHHLPHFAGSIKAYNARRRFRGAVRAVVSTLRMTHDLRERRASRESRDSRDSREDDGDAPAPAPPPKVTFATLPAASEATAPAPLQLPAI